jgi:hypothetical protein
MVFVSTGKVTGNTGIAAADTMCQNEATSAGLSGNYRAFLSTETVGAVTRLGNSRGWVRPDGKPFADRIEDFLNADSDADRIFYPPRITAAGTDAGRAWVLTGSTFSGTPRTGYTCASWTVTEGTPGSGFGYATGAGYIFSSVASTGCSTQFSVYCFGVGNVSRVSVTPVSGRRAFMSKGTWSPGAGISTADALCQSEANSAGFSGSFRALLATNGASAASRFDTSGPPWVRPDGVPLMPSAAQVFQSNVTMWNVALNTSADLTRQYGNWFVYSGEPTPSPGVNPLTQPGTAASTCDNWTSAAAGSGRGGAGTAGESSLLEAFTDKQWGCNYGGAARIACFQQ